MSDEVPKACRGHLVSCHCLFAPATFDGGESWVRTLVGPWAGAFAAWIDVLPSVPVITFGCVVRRGLDLI